RSRGWTSAVADTVNFYRCMFYFLVYPGLGSRRGAFESCPFFPDRRQARVQCYSLALIFYLWSKPHYRNASYQEDMVKNLRNVAVPGTGLPLSVVSHFRIVALLFVLFVNPILCLAAALNGLRRFKRPWADAYCEQLLCPQDWFSFWRLNCRLASYHALETGSPGYAQEDKWTFLVDGMKKGVPVSPVLDTPALVVKDKNEEGGLGIFFYKNALHGGDWILQERLYNDAFVSSLLPSNAPLSTMRVITASRWWLERQAGRADADIGADCVAALSSVFRAGRAGASTDHSSILFDVDAATGAIRRGTTNAHWYRLGPAAMAGCPWTSTHDAEVHPDCDTRLTGAVIPDMAGILKTVREAHRTMLPDVPLVGWDVAMTTRGICLLEVNLSCNFFRGSFDVDAYIELIDDYFVALERLR
ncbi:unnamed protein product, partial [Phaeothamnion confervicola]